MGSLDGKNVVITGAASGLGRSLALALAGKGCRIGAADIDIEGAESTLEMVTARGGSGETFGLDVSSKQHVEAMAEHFFREWGRVDLLVNNAGVMVVGPTGQVGLEDWEWVIAANFWGTVYGCHSFVPRMKGQRGGHVLNVASSAGIVNLPEMAPYNTSKAAVISLSETLRAELAPFDIGVTVLCPMIFDTGLLKRTRWYDHFAAEFWPMAFKHSRMSSDRVAELAIAAVEKNRLYCLPQPSARIHWAQKRLTGSGYYGLMSLLNRRGWLKPLQMWLARNGLA